MNNLAVSLLQVGAQILGAHNPLWPLASILEMAFSTIWPTVLCDL